MFFTSFCSKNYLLRLVYKRRARACPVSRARCLELFRIDYNFLKCKKGTKLPWSSFPSLDSIKLLSLNFETFLLKVLSDLLNLIWYSLKISELLLPFLPLIISNKVFSSSSKEIFEAWKCDSFEIALITSIFSIFLEDLISAALPDSFNKKRPDLISFNSEVFSTTLSKSSSRIISS